MKKILIFAGALLFAAVFMSGCVTEAEDPVVGVWHAETDYAISTGSEFDSLSIVLAADGTGYSLAGFTDELVSGKLDITWENAGDGKYLITHKYLGPVAVSQAVEFVLEGDVLTSLSGPAKAVYHRETVAEYVPGLWTGIRGDYNEYTDIQVLLYLGADGKGNTVVYGPEVLNLEDIFTAEFTWDAKEDKVVLTGANGGSFELPLVNGELVFAGLYPLHKYTIEDSLYGLWQSAELYVEDGVSYDIVEVIKSDGTGVEIWTVPGSDKASFRYTFTWEMTGAKTYKAVYDDGEVWEFNSVGVRLFDGGLWYNKVGFDVLQDYAQSKVTA